MWSWGGGVEVALPLSQRWVGEFKDYKINTNVSPNQQKEEKTQNKQCFFPFYLAYGFIKHILQWVDKASKLRRDWLGCLIYSNEKLLVDKRRRFAGFRPDTHHKLSSQSSLAIECRLLWFITHSFWDSVEKNPQKPCIAVTEHAITLQGTMENRMYYANLVKHSVLKEPWF